MQLPSESPARYTALRQTPPTTAPCTSMPHPEPVFTRHAPDTQARRPRASPACRPPSSVIPQAIQLPDRLARGAAMHRASCPDGSGGDFDNLALGVLNLVHHLCRPGISRPGRACRCRDLSPIPQPQQPAPRPAPHQLQPAALPVQFAQVTEGRGTGSVATASAAWPQALAGP